MKNQGLICIDNIINIKCSRGSELWNTLQSHAESGQYINIKTDTIDGKFFVEREYWVSDHDFRLRAVDMDRDEKLKSLCDYITSQP
jgi:hypothetical protein